MMFMSLIHGTWSTPPYSGNWTGTDYVAGTLTVTLDELRPSDTPDGVTLTSQLIPIFLNFNY